MSKKQYPYWITEAAWAIVNSEAWRRLKAGYPMTYSQQRELFEATRKQLQTAGKDVITQ